MNWVEKTKLLTDISVNNGETSEDMFLSATEELGEISTCLSVRKKRKNKVLSETVSDEAVDLAICALSIFFAEGGTIEQLEEIGMKKLNKWEGYFS
jgi:hypothetical protein